MTDVIRCASLQTAERVMQRLALLEPGVWVADPPGVSGSVRIHRVENDDQTTSA